MTLTATQEAAGAARYPRWNRYDDATKLWILAGETAADDNQAEADLANAEMAADAAREAARRPAVVNTATDKQMAFLTKLAAERGVEVPPVTNKIEASAAIDYLLKLPKAAAPKAAAPKAELVGHGYYAFGVNIVKVQEARNGSGRVYAKVLNAETKTFEYVAGLVGKLTAEMRLTEAQAAEFGRLYGTCCICARDLTDETSIARGIGPVCAGKQGW